MNVPSVNNPISRLPLRCGFLLVALALAWLALSPLARAACNDGCDFTHGNTFLGVFALGANTTGSENTAVGDTALNFNTTGSYNTAVGFDALQVNTTGSANTATGFGALFKNTGSGNTAFGSSALEFNRTGNYNTATGADALYHNTTASDNTATGLNALFNNTTGSDNTATGVGALKANTIGFDNTADGFQALYSNTGSTNIALGYLAGHNLTTGSNNIDIGNQGVAAEASTIRIGTVGNQTKTFVAGIHGVAVTGTAVVVNTSGQLGVPPSSERFKEQIKPMDTTSDALLSLRPVTFRYKKDIDPKGAQQFGLVAEDVEKVDPDLVVRDEKGKAFTVRYDAVNAMLLNEFLKEHRKVEEQEATIAQLKKDFQSKLAEQHKQIEALSAGLQKVTAQLETSTPVQTLANNQ